MDSYIEEMFNDYSNSFEAPDLNKNIILIRSVKYHQSYEKEILNPIQIFHDCLKQTGNLKVARIEAGISFKKSLYYIHLINKIYLQARDRLFYNKEIKRRKRNGKNLNWED